MVNLTFPVVVFCRRLMLFANWSSEDYLNIAKSCAAFDFAWQAPTSPAPALSRKPLDPCTPRPQERTTRRRELRLIVRFARASPTSVCPHPRRLPRRRRSACCACRFLACKKKRVLGHLPLSRSLAAEQEIRRVSSALCTSEMSALAVAKFSVDLHAWCPSATASWTEHPAPTEASNSRSPVWWIWRRLQQVSRIASQDRLQDPPSGWPSTSLHRSMICGSPRAKPPPATC